MTDMFTYWADSLARVHNFTAGCYCAGFEGSDDPDDGIPFVGIFYPYPETVEENDGRDFIVRVEWRGDPAIFVAEFEDDVLELEALRQSC